MRNYLIRLLPWVCDAKLSLLHVFCRVRSMLSPVSAYSSQSSLQNSPWSLAFPPAPPPLVTQYCTALSLVLCQCLTSQQRTRQDYGHRPSLTDPACLPSGTAEISRFSNIECPRMLRFYDSAGPVCDSLHLSSSYHIAFPISPQGRHPGWVISELNGWPTFSPVNASRATSRLPAHDSGP